MRLRCISPYRAVVTSGGANMSVVYMPGEIVEDAGRTGWLLRDAPSSFEVVDDQPVVQALDAPPADRMVRRGRTTRRGAE